MAKQEHTLKFGLRDAVPDEVQAAWGARWIYPDQLVADRTSHIGEPDPVRELLAYLRETVGNIPNQRARELDMSGAMSRQSETDVTLFEDNRCVVVGNPRASSGYLYVAGWLKPHEPLLVTLESFEDELDELQSACEYSSEPTEDGKHPVTGADVNDSVDALIGYKDALEDLLARRWAPSAAWERLEQELTAHTAGDIDACELCARAMAIRAAVDSDDENHDDVQTTAGSPAVRAMDPYELRCEAERIVGADKVPREVLERLVSQYGDARP